LVYGPTLFAFIVRTLCVPEGRCRVEVVSTEAPKTRSPAFDIQPTLPESQSVACDVAPAWKAIAALGRRSTKSDRRRKPFASLEAVVKRASPKIRDAMVLPPRPAELHAATNPGTPKSSCPKSNWPIEEGQRFEVATARRLGPSGSVGDVRIRAFRSRRLEIAAPPIGSFTPGQSLLHGDGATIRSLPARAR
jgi:hypothetical protein